MNYLWVLIPWAQFSRSWRIKRVTVQVPDDLHKQIKLLAVETDKTMQAIFLDAVKLYLQQTENVDTKNTPWSDAEYIPNKVSRPVNTGFIS